MPKLKIIQIGQITELEANLSSLLKAVEQVSDHSAFINDQVRCADIEMLFDNLNSVVQKIKGEKG